MTRAGPTSGDQRNGQPFLRHAEPVFAFIEDMENLAHGGASDLSARARHCLAGFESALATAGVDPVQIKPARYGLAVLIDQKARNIQSLRIAAWTAAAHKHLFDGRDMSLASVRDFHATACRAGSEFSDLSVFLEDILDRSDRRRRAARTLTRTGWGRNAAAAIAVFIVALGAYTAFLEIRYHRNLVGVFHSEISRIDVDFAAPEEVLGYLDRLKQASSRVSDAAQASPLKSAVSLPYANSADAARAAYSGAVNLYVPGLIAGKIEEVLATEGDALLLYDALRAWSLLSGGREMGRVYLRGWTMDREKGTPLDGLSAHLEVLSDEGADVLAPDPETLDQARLFASEATESARAWLELRRSEEAQDLPRWLPDETVPGLTEVVQRRSGAAVSDGLPGLFTQTGWAWARDFGAGVAVQEARRLAPEILRSTPSPQNETPDLIMNRLQDETVAAWRGWLADLRVRPFSDREAALMISGALAARTSPLTELMTEVWVQVGGADRLRPHPQQLRIATAFGQMIQYVEQGRMAEIGTLFSALNVALGTVDHDAEQGVDRLMSVQERADSVRALQGAPRIVVEIAEDVLAQTSAAHASLLSNPLTQRWQRDVFSACKSAFEGRFPFAEGPDADLDTFARILAPGGRIDRFFRTNAERFLDMDAQTWRWKPEARFAGLSPETATFFQRAQAVSASYFTPDGQLAAPITLTALAERGTTSMRLGGESAAIRATGEPGVLVWPGPLPSQGIEVTFGRSVSEQGLTQPGPWGLIRLLDGLRLRPRDGGQRILVDMRAPGGRVFVELAFASSANPVSARPLLKGFACPPVL